MKNNVGMGGARICEKFSYYLHKIKIMNKTFLKINFLIKE